MELLSLMAFYGIGVITLGVICLLGGLVCAVSLYLIIKGE